MTDVTKKTFVDGLEAENSPKLRKMREIREAREKALGITPKPQEPPPTLFPDLYWIWETFCFLSERRGVGASGPLPITVEAMSAYTKIRNRYMYPYTDQVMTFVPILDREYMRDFYEKQKADIDKSRRQSERGAKRGSSTPRPNVGNRAPRR